MRLRSLTVQAIGPFAGRHTVDLDALGSLWGTEYTETKSRVGQMLLQFLPQSAAITLVMHHGSEVGALHDAGEENVHGGVGRTGGSGRGWRPSAG